MNEALHRLAVDRADRTDGRGKRATTDGRRGVAVGATMLPGPVSRALFGLLMNSLWAAMLVSSTSSCAALVPLNATTFDRYLTQDFDAELSECFDAAQGALTELKLPLEASDQNSGTVISGRGPASEFAKLSNRPRAGSNELRDYAVRIGLSVVDAPNERRCSVRVIKFELWRDGKPVQQVDPAWALEKLWRPLMDSISEHFLLEHPTPGCWAPPTVGDKGHA